MGRRPRDPAISNGVDGGNLLRVSPEIGELPSQLHNGLVEGPRCPLVLIPPHLVENTIAGNQVADKLRVVNTPFPTNVYDLVGILREWPGPATQLTCSRQAWDPDL
jgi:hypothetical protein